MASSDKFPVGRSLYAWGAAQMGKGALVGAAVFFGAILFILVLRGIGALLPEDPYAALEIGRQGLVLVG